VWYEEREEREKVWLGGGREGDLRCVSGFGRGI
jgi:hypothetical protein